MTRNVTRAEFDAACAALWTEIEHQNNLPRRTEDEAKDVPGFLTLGRRYLRKIAATIEAVEDAWADNPGTMQPEGGVQVEEALHGLRKVAAIFVRGMVYNGIRQRGQQ